MIKKESRKRIYIVIVKFRSYGHWKEATSHFAYIWHSVDSKLNIIVL